MLIELCRRRERPQVMTRRWLKVWAKRLLTFPALMRVQWRVTLLRARGGRIGDLAMIEKCRIDGHLQNLEIARGAFIGEGSELILHDRISIGEQAVINRRVTILTASHRLRDPAWSQYHRPVRIGDRAWIATGATLLPGVSIGRGAVVGAGAVVRSDVPDYALAIGNPATIQRDARTRELHYDTAFFPAAFEAWLGPHSTTPGMDQSQK